MSVCRKDAVRMAVACVTEMLLHGVHGVHVHEQKRRSSNGSGLCY